MFVINSGEISTVKEREGQIDTPLGEVKEGESFTLPGNKLLLVPRGLDVILYR